MTVLSVNVGYLLPSWSYVRCECTCTGVGCILYLLGYAKILFRSCVMWNMGWLYNHTKSDTYSIYKLQVRGASASWLMGSPVKMYVIILVIYKESSDIVAYTLLQNCLNITSFRASPSF
jgi:hypothetical protein